jgi:hypothetical protein
MNAKKSWNWSLWIGFLCVLAGFLTYTFFAPIPNYTRLSVGESLVICCGRDSTRAGSIPRLWKTADLSGKNLRTNSSRARRIDVRFVFLHILLRTGAGSAFDRSATSWTKSSRVHSVGSRWEGPISQWPRWQIESRRADFLSRFLVTIVQLRVAEFSAKAFRH